MLIGNVVENVHIFNDGMSSQFCSRFVFVFLSKTQLGKNITWHYNEGGRGKGPTDGIGGLVENLVRALTRTYRGRLTAPSQMNLAEYFPD